MNMKIMEMGIRLLPFALLALPLPTDRLYAQHNINNKERWKEYLEEMVASRDDDTDLEGLYNDLSQIISHPIDLNNATPNDLHRLPFLSAEQIERIIAHRKKYGRIVSIYELKDIEAIDFPTIELLIPFVHVDAPNLNAASPTLRSALAESRHDLQINYEQCLQTKAGYRAATDSSGQATPGRRYLGPPFYHSLKYGYTSGNIVCAGLAAEKDAGETFAKGYDFYSAHIIISNLKCLQALALGDYRATFGQGLAIGLGGFPRHIFSLPDAERRNEGFSRHGSTGEHLFLRGAAAAVQWKSIRVSAFYSYRKLDATISNGAAASIKTDGLHRLPADLDKAGKLRLQTAGGNLHYSSQGISVGLTLVSNIFINHPFIPPLRLDNMFNFRGRSSLNLSVDYRLRRGRLSFFGETATSGSNAIATLNAISCAPASNLGFLILHRHYAKAYNAFWSNGFAQSPRVQNEQGFYAAASFSPIPKLNISACADRFAHPWPTYGIDAPSYGTEYSMRADYANLQSASFHIRYRHTQNEKSSTPLTGGTAEILPASRRAMRIGADYSLPRCRLGFITSADAVIYAANQSTSRGLMLSHRTEWTPSALPLRLSLYAALFNAGDYNARLAMREKNLPGRYSLIQTYGSGLRLSLTGRWDLRPGYSLHIKVGDTWRADSETVGSELEEIIGGRKTDVQVAARILIK